MDTPLRESCSPHGMVGCLPPFSYISFEKLQRKTIEVTEI